MKQTKIDTELHSSSRRVNSNLNCIPVCHRKIQHKLKIITKQKKTEQQEQKSQNKSSVHVFFNFFTERNAECLQMITERISAGPYLGRR